MAFDGLLLLFFCLAFLVFLGRSIEKSSEKKESPWNVNLHDRKIQVFLLFCGFGLTIISFTRNTGNVEFIKENYLAGILMSFAPFLAGVIAGLSFLSIMKQLKNIVR